MQISGGWIHAQSVTVSSGWNELGRADRSGVEQQLRKECWAIADRCGARESLKHVERGYVRAGRICGQVQHRHAFIVTERIRHVHPVEDMRYSPQRFDAVRRRFVIFAPSHGYI